MTLMNPLVFPRLALSFARIVRDPTRLDAILELAAARDVDIERASVAHFRARGFDRVLAERPRLGPIDLDALAERPVGSLGRAFAEHVHGAGLDLAALPSLPAHDPESFVRAHLIETHDLWHVATGFGSDVAGELGLQAFYAAQHVDPFPVAVLSAGMLNTLLFEIGDSRERLAAMASGWDAGRVARPLFGYPWSRRWSTPLVAVRVELGLPADGVPRLPPALAA
jgi:ubiquinone biosynthesis protein Coq4